MRLFGFDITRRSSNPPRDPALSALLGGFSNASGVTVNATTSMRSTALWGCVRTLAETMASLPIEMFERMKNGSKRRATDHSLYPVVHRRPNGWQTSAEWRECMMMCLTLRGAGYARIKIAPDGKRSLIPLAPDSVRAALIDERVVYQWRTGRGQFETLLQDEVLRIPYVCMEGVEPLSPIRVHAETIGVALTSTKYTANFLRNGGRPPGFIKLDVPFKDPEKRKSFREFIQSQLGGENQGSTLLLEQGTYTPIGISNEDAQLIEIAKMSVHDICRIYRMPPHKVGALEEAKWANVEQQQISFVVDTIGPWCVRWEQALSRDLLAEDEQERFFFEFNLAGLLRGDIKSRYGAYAVGRQWGWLSINDVRDLENMNRIGEGGDDYMTPLNMVPAGSIDTTGGGNGDGNGTQNG